MPLREPDADAAVAGLPTGRTANRTAAGAALIALLAVTAALVAAILLTTPWDPLGVPADQVVATEPARDFTPAEQARAEEFRGLVRPIAYASLATGLAVALVLGLTPLGARLVTAAARPAGGGWKAAVLLGGLAVLLAVRLATLPYAAWGESIRRSYGLSTRSWWGWAADVLRAFALESVLTLAVLLALVALARAMPRWWWVPAAIGGAAMVVVVSFAYPLVVEPVFNRFEPMPDGPLRSSLLALAEEEGVEVGDVLVADASRRTSTLNAYVSGFGVTKRIVVYDTLLEGAPAEEVRLVVAHELGHAADNDVLAGTLLGALGVAAAVCGIAVIVSRPRLLARAGATGPGDPRIVPLVLAVVAVLTLATGPVQSLVSRRVETRADVHALEATGDPQTFASLQRSLALASLSDLDPPPVVYGLFATHPTAPMRIAIARTWSEATGGPEIDDLAPVAGSAG